MRLRCLARAAAIMMAKRIKQATIHNIQAAKAVHPSEQHRS
jgi:hypothetical protein